MARRGGILHAIAQSQREAERLQKAQLREQAQAVRAYEQAQKAYERATVADQKEKARLYAESRAAQATMQTEEVERFVAALGSLLADTLAVDDFFDLDSLKQQPAIAPFDPGQLAVAEPPPDPASYAVAPLSALQKLVPGAKAKHAQQNAEAQQRLDADRAAHAAHEAERQAKLTELRQEYDQVIAQIQSRTAAQHADIEELKHAYAAGRPDVVATYSSLVIETSLYPEGFPQKARVAYVPESKQLVVEYDLPPFEIVPAAVGYKYAKAKDEITETPRPAAQRKTLYASAIAQVTLRTLHELFEADRARHIETLILNGYVDSIDRATGQPARTCVVTVRTSRDTFAQINLAQVDPAACLKALNASVSKSPAELAPVRPVLEFSMVDPRFIEEVDVLSSLDQRRNLMELSPSEFEALISNLFAKMGLETRLTQASRDGGVDCVAFDPRPIFGGKVVIQAKRYKNTVGVSAVRDLFGTVQNEGASKGILVTTSGYGKAAFEFAAGKPLELLSGSNLLHLLAEHAGIEAKIEMPADWKDPHPDGGG